MMKKILYLILPIVVLAGILFYRTTLRKREIVILSTNDIHGTLSTFPNLVSAIKECRDSVETILVDAGDRWTGNAFVDLAEGRLPIIDLMNYAGYDVATLGNHEFDKGAALLQGAIDHAQFPIVCANIKSNRAELQSIEPTVDIKTSNGIKICFTGVVTAYANGHPDGDDAVFEGLEFTESIMAAKESGKLCKDADVRVLLSHMGDAKDIELAMTSDCYDVIIGGHTHMFVDTLVCNTVIGQTGRKLKCIGATRILMKGDKIADIQYENIPLAGYQRDSVTVEMIKKIEDNPTLNTSIGLFVNRVTHTGFANLETKVIAEATNADIGFYHYGGIRILDYPAGDISLLTLYNLEPFQSKIHTIDMTPEQMRQMIITKFNDTKNAKESHRVDLFSTTPYSIVVDLAGEAVDVRFPKLRENRKYRVAMADYIGKTYEKIEGDNHTEHDLLVVDLIEDYVKKHTPIQADNIAKQQIIKK